MRAAGSMKVCNFFGCAAVWASRPPCQYQGHHADPTHFSVKVAHINSVSVQSSSHIYVVQQGQSREAAYLLNYAKTQEEVCGATLHN